MTNEQFSQEYRLLDRLSEGSVVSHYARSATGAMVMVHFLCGIPDENAGVLRMIDRLDADRRARVVSVTDVDGRTAVVTKFILDFTSLHEWLASSDAPTVGSSSIAGSVPGVGSQQRGEFTRIFQGEVAPPLASPAPPRQNGPGEFTLLFRGTPAAGQPVPGTPAEPHREPPPSSSATAFEPPPGVQPPALPTQATHSPTAAAGDFTMMFGTPSPDASPPSAPDIAAAPQDEPAPRPSSPLIAPSGTDLPVSPPRSPFQPPAPLQRLPQQWTDEPAFAPVWQGFTAAPTPPILQPPQLSQPPATPGEYTRLFGNVTAPPSPSPSPPLRDMRASSLPAPTTLNWEPSGTGSGPRSGDSYFERLAGTPAVRGSDPGPAPVNSLPPAPPQSFTGPSEFTRIVSSPSAIPGIANAGPRAVAPPAPPLPSGAAPERQSGDRVLLFSLIGVVILAMIFVGVFVLAT